MTRAPIPDWLRHLEARPHPEAGRYSQLGDAALWRLQAVRSGRIHDVELDDTATTAEFVGVAVDELAGHLNARAAARRCDSGSKAQPQVARRWLEQRARLWAALSLEPVDDELEAYETQVRALLDHLQLELGAATEALEGVGPTLLTQAQVSEQDGREAQSVERGLNAVTTAQEALASLRRRMIL